MQFVSNFQLRLTAVSGSCAEAGSSIIQSLTKSNETPVGFTVVRARTTPGGAATYSCCFSETVARSFDGPNTTWQNTTQSHGPNTTWQNTTLSHGPNTTWQNTTLSHGPNTTWQNTTQSHGPTLHGKTPHGPHGPNTTWQNTTPVWWSQHYMAKHHAVSRARYGKTPHRSRHGPDMKTHHTGHTDKTPHRSHEHEMKNHYTGHTVPIWQNTTQVPRSQDDKTPHRSHEPDITERIITCINLLYTTDICNSLLELFFWCSKVFCFTKIEANYQRT